MMKTQIAQLPKYGQIPGFEKFVEKFGEQPKIGDIFSALLPYIYILAGLILFAYLILGGFELLTSAGDPKAIESAKGKITHAIIGFIIIFISYWLAQILEIVFGISILG